MGRYVTKRLLILLPTFFGITVLVYVLSAMAPGSPLEQLLQDPYITAEQYQMKLVEYGLDKPVIIQYYNWLKLLLRGDFGISFSTMRPVIDMVLERVWPTLLLTITSVVVAVILSIPIGIMAAYHPYSKWDYVSSGFSFLGSAIPPFLLGLIGIYIFSAKMHWLPMGGMYNSTGKREIGDLIFHLILPVMVLSFQIIGNVVSQVRSAVTEVLQENYIITARAKGISEKKVILAHALRNSLIPVVTVISNMLPMIIGGAVVTEQLLSWPGIGRLMVTAILARDYPVIMGATVFISAFILIGNLIADIVYAFLDPKIRHQL